MDKDPQTITDNLLAWAALTDLCLVLRRSVLMATLPEEEAERRLFEEIREIKESQWLTNRS